MSRVDKQNKIYWNSCREKNFEDCASAEGKLHFHPPWPPNEHLCTLSDSHIARGAQGKEDPLPWALLDWISRSFVPGVSLKDQVYPVVLLRGAKERPSPETQSPVTNRWWLYPPLLYGHNKYPFTAQEWG